MSQTVSLAQGASFTLLADADVPQAVFPEKNGDCSLGLTMHLSFETGNVDVFTGLRSIDVARVEYTRNVSSKLLIPLIALGLAWRWVVSPLKPEEFGCQRFWIIVAKVLVALVALTLGLVPSVVALGLGTVGAACNPSMSIRFPLLSAGAQCSHAGSACQDSEGGYHIYPVTTATKIVSNLKVFGVGDAVDSVCATNCFSPDLTSLNESQTVVYTAHDPLSGYEKFNTIFVRAVQGRLLSDWGHECMAAWRYGCVDASTQSLGWAMGNSQAEFCDYLSLYGTLQFSLPRDFSSVTLQMGS